MNNLHKLNIILRFFHLSLGLWVLGNEVGLVDCHSEVIYCVEQLRLDDLLEKNCHLHLLHTKIILPLLKQHQMVSFCHFQFLEYPQSKAEEEMYLLLCLDHGNSIV